MIGVVIVLSLSHTHAHKRIEIEISLQMWEVVGGKIIFFHKKL